jgi:type VI secretion system protein ImpA
MSSAPYEVESLVIPLSADAPSGPALDHDPDFQTLERVSAGTPERQYGDKIYPAEPPDWQQVFDLALNLIRRSRDLRMAVWLARSGAHLHGLAGGARGLQLVRALLERQWDTVHPQLDAEDNNDPTMRMNALTPLAARGEAPADFRAAGLTASRGSLTLRDLELGLGKDEAHGSEVRPTEAGVMQGLGDLVKARPEAAEALRAAHEAAKGISTTIESRAGSAAPNLAGLIRLFTVGVDALARLSPTDGGAGDTPAPRADPGAVPPARAASPGAIQSRSDAVRELERLCEWFERNEPGHPAPLLMRRAQRLMSMTFLQIMQDMAPGAIDQVQTIAGPPPE